MSIERFPVRDREHWMALRGQDVTASVAAALLGVHPFMTYYGLWMLKAGRLKEDAEMSAPMRRGLMLEQPAVQLLQEARPTWRITRARQYFRDPEIRLGATPDAYATDPERGPGLVQVKTIESSAFRKNWRDEDGEIQVPLWIAVQAIVEAHLTGRKWACVAALTVGFGVDLHVIDIPLHEGVIDRIRARTVEFWRSIEDGRPPDPDYARDGALLGELYPVDNGGEIDLSGSNRLPAVIRRRQRHAAYVKAAKARIDEWDAEIKAALGEHQRAKLPGYVVTWKLQNRAGYTVAPTSFRQLRIKEVV